MITVEKQEMNSTPTDRRNRWLPIGVLVALAVGVAVAMTLKVWRDAMHADSTRTALPADDTRDNAGHDDAAHDHSSWGHAGHDETTALELSASAWKNIGLKTGVIQPRSYVKTVSVPAMIAERPGRSQVEITTPLTGIVTRIHPIEGEAVEPGQPLFDVRLTHEDLVTAQRDFLRSVEELDVVKREVQRLQSVGEGVVAGRRVLQHRYEQQKIQAALHAQRQGLLLHGLDDQKIDAILATRKLLQDLTVTAPPFAENADHGGAEHLYHVQTLAVKRGQHVVAGDPLGVLADHCLLYIEGQAFEDDAQRLIQAAKEDRPVTVSPVDSGDVARAPAQLRILYVADHIDPESRALRFYLGLPNRVVHSEPRDGRRFIAWEFRPGQRMEVRIPAAEPWEDELVLPSAAVVEQGAEAFVFQQNGKRFDRVPVHVIYRDKDVVVVENDGSLVGRTVAMSGAYQMQLALKNRTSVPVDPHVGHAH